MDCLVAGGQGVAPGLYAERLETLLKSVWPTALKGDLKAIEEARKLMEQQERLFEMQGEVGRTSPYDGPELRLAEE